MPRVLSQTPSAVQSRRWRAKQKATGDPHGFLAKQNASCKKWSKDHKEERIKYYRKYEKDNRERRAADALKYRRLAIHQLGGKCACCGELSWWNLTIDHIEPVSVRRRPRANIGKYYRQVIEAPEGVYQILCFGCNNSKRDRDRCTLDHSELRA